MKIIIPGGSGQVGTVLSRAFHSVGHEVLVLSRRPKPGPWRVMNWDARTIGEWAGHFDGADAIINLTGRSVDCRYTSVNRNLIVQSRIDSTRVVGEAIARAPHPPRVWLQAGTATIYAHRYDAPNDDISGILGGSEPNVPETWRFSIDVATAWEKAFNDAVTPGTRKVIMRSAMTMSPDRGGVFDALLRLVRFGLGGRVGNGRQYVSWIHDQDFIRAVSWLMDHDEVSGPVNLASPNPLPYSEFIRFLRNAKGVAFGLPTPKWMLEIGAFFIRTESELVLKSRRVVPAPLCRAGFHFHYPAWADAAQDLCNRWN
jgi:uncharacterized protein (TIGR01777 family)